MEDTGRAGDKRLRDVKDLTVYRKAFSTAMKIYALSKGFPKEERYSLTDQIRRSSRSVCANMAEGWRKRRYRAVFVNKLTDACQEASETQTWLEFARECQLIDNVTFEELNMDYNEVLAMLSGIERKAVLFCQ